MCAVNLGAGGRACAESLRQATRIDIQILPDLTVVETTHEETTPLAESAVAGAAQASWVVEGNQTFEIVEAFTRKADGRKIPADPKDFVTQDGAVGAAASYVDLKLQQVQFRDLAVGDTAVLTLRITEKQHYIPNRYSRTVVNAPGVVRKSIDVTLRTPAALDVHHDEQLLTYEESRQDDQVVRHWSGTTAPATVNEKDIAELAFSVPALRISTFPDFESIASAYYERAREKAAVTPEIQRLADEITKDKVDVREQARAIYEWVTRNIRYVAVYFGNGRFVPNETSTILSRRFGDCKDDATLLSALLAAKGIASEQVLISTLPVYRQARTATLGAVNHVIVYIPALDRYVDPTVAFGNFDRLPGADSGRPVVRVSDKGVTVARTPIPSVEDNVIEIDSRMTTARDGQRSGQTTITARGEFADVMRAFIAQTEARGKDLVLPVLAQERGIPGGSYDLEAPPWTDAHEPFRVTTKWTLPKATNASESRFKIPPGFSPVMPNPDLFFGTLEATKRTYPANCRAGRAVYTLHVALPENVVSVKLPAAIKRSSPQFSFREEWTREGQQLRRRTEVTSFVATRVCSPEQVDAVRTTFRGIGNRSYPMVYSSRTGAETAAQPSLLQQLFGAQPAANRPRPDAAAPARNPTSRSAVHSPTQVDR
jgi:transglutaminase-like putative cysteine protease